MHLGSMHQRAILLAGLWVLVLCSAAAVPAAAAAFVGDKQDDYSCENISKVPREKQCTVIRTHCPSESLVPYAEWYFCSVAPHHAVLRTIYIAAVCCLLPLAFCLLGDTAEFYIAPIMAHVSQAIPKMRPRFAGVTFVALGNGAPDLSANIAAISAGEVVLSAGAFTGAAMFVQCVVAAELIGLAGEQGIKCGGAMLRDVGVYCLAIFSVLLAFTLGKISQAFVGWAVALYILYMIWVFAGDEWHQRGRPKPQLDGQSFKALLTRIASLGAISDAVAGRRSSTGGSRAAVSHHTSREELEESLLPWVVAEDEEANFLDQHISPDLRMPSGGTGPPPAFETTLPSPVAPGQAVHRSAGGVSWEGGGGGSRPGSLTSQADRSTELSAAGRGSMRGAQGALLSSAGGSSRRISAPSFQGAAGSSGGGSSGDWPPGVHGMQRHASASSALPPGLRPAILGWDQQQPIQRASTAADSRPWQHQQPGGAGRPGGVVHPHLMSLGRQSFIDPKTYKQLVWADLADDEEEEARLEREIARQLLVGAERSRATSGAAGGAGSYQPPTVSSTPSSPWPSADVQHPAASAAATSDAYAATSHASSADGQQEQHTPRAQHHLAQLPGASPSAADGSYLSPFGSEGVRTGPNTPRMESAAAAGVWEESDMRQAGPYHQQQQYQPPLQQQLEAVREGGGGGSGGEAWQQLQWQLTLGNSEEWQDAGPIRQLFRKVTFPLLLPAYLGQRLTIPFASASGYSREWLISSLLCFPLALIAYLGLFTLPGVLAACGVGICAAVLGAVLTAWDQPGQMAVQGLGGKAAAAVPGVLAVLAFCMGVVWIDTIATEVVAIISFLAGLASLPSGVMGLTLLAWGNSLGDYFGNRAMAKAGHTSTAITACFAAPLFNMLISLACGFSSYLHKLGKTSVHVALTPEVALGCMFLIGYNIAIITVGKLCGWRLPPWFKHFARAWYGLYFTLAVASGFYQQHSSSSS